MKMFSYFRWLMIFYIPIRAIKRWLLKRLLKPHRIKVTAGQHLEAGDLVYIGNDGKAYSYGIALDANTVLVKGELELGAIAPSNVWMKRS